MNLIASFFAALVVWSVPHSVLRKHPIRHLTSHRIGRHYEVESTCYNQGSITASGSPVFLGEVANNFLPLGTRIRFDRPVFGRRDYIVLDRIGWGSQLDIYNPSEATCMMYGRESLGFTVGT